MFNQNVMTNLNMNLELLTIKRLIIMEQNCHRFALNTKFASTSVIITFVFAMKLPVIVIVSLQSNFSMFNHVSVITCQRWKLKTKTILKCSISMQKSLREHTNGRPLLVIFWYVWFRGATGPTGNPGLMTG